MLNGAGITATLGEIVSVTKNLWKGIAIGAIWIAVGLTMFSAHPIPTEAWWAAMIATVVIAMVGES